MLFIGISSAVAAIACAMMSWAKGSEVWLVAAMGASFLAAATVVAVWASEEPVRLEWKVALKAILFTMAGMALVPAVLTGLIWFFMWVVVPSVLILPIIFSWELIQLEIDPVRRPILSPQHA
jgi:hypothetical protein